MSAFTHTYEVRWADMDPNSHMRHTAYNDYAAQTRVAMFSHYGLSMDEIARSGLGPILFREETRFLKEVHMMEQITVDCALTQMRRDGSRWSFRHQIFLESGTQAAEITVDGAWLDLEKRKLGTPGEQLKEVILKLPRTETFEWTSDH